MPIFSIIVPIYNAQSTLHRCFNSLQNQTYQDFEVLMIENGSTDNSGAICKEYAEKDNRFKFIACKENKGPSVARNIGISNTTGIYTAFLDSDDYVDSNYLEVLFEAFKNSDVVFFGYHQISVNENFKGDYIPQVTENEYYDVLISLYKQGLFGYTWVKAFRRDVIGESRFQEDLNLLEDEVFACMVMIEPKRIAVIPEAILSYVTGNSGSLIGRIHQDYCRKVDAAYNAWKILLRPYKKREEVLVQMANDHVSRCMYYGFERNINVKEYFTMLADSEFFKNATYKSRFTLAVKNHNYGKLTYMRAVYRFKNKIAKLLKR